MDSPRIIPSEIYQEINSDEKRKETGKVREGLSEGNIEIICCADCDKELLKTVVIKENDLVSKITVECGSCNGSSFMTKINGKFVFEAINPFKISDTQVEMLEHYSKIKVKTNYEH